MSEWSVTKRHVDDGEAAHADREVRADVDTGAVGSTVHDRAQHGVEQLGVGAGEPGDAAHPDQTTGLVPLDRGSAMAGSDAATVREYLDALPDDRCAALGAVREVILANLPDGYVETMNWGMITYEVPH